MLRFEYSRLVYWKDIERNPYLPNSKPGIEWTKNDERRLLLIALDRYLRILKYLKDTNQYLRD